MAHSVEKRIELHDPASFNDVCSAAWGAGAFVKPDATNPGVVLIVCNDDDLTAVKEAIAAANVRPFADVVASPVDGLST